MLCFFQYKLFFGTGETVQDRIRTTLHNIHRILRSHYKKKIKWVTYLIEFCISSKPLMKIFIIEVHPLLASFQTVDKVPKCHIFYFALALPAWLIRNKISVQTSKWNFLIAKFWAPFLHAPLANRPVLNKAAKDQGYIAFRSYITNNFTIKYCRHFISCKSRNDFSPQINGKLQNWGYVT